MSYPIVRENVSARRLTLNGWWFEVATGTMYAYDAGERLFEIIDRRVARRLA
jgi:carbonic anhydrase